MDTLDAEIGTIKERYVGVANRTATLTVAGWTGASAPFTPTVSVTGMLATDTPIVDIVLSGTQATAENELAGWACVSKIETGAGNITATCFASKPEAALTLILKVVR